MHKQRNQEVIDRGMTARTNAQLVRDEAARVREQCLAASLGVSISVRAGLANSLNSLDYNVQAVVDVGNGMRCGDMDKAAAIFALDEACPRLIDDLELLDIFIAQVNH